MSNRRNRRGGKARQALDAGEKFTFTAGGKTYTLPPAAPYAEKITAGHLIDAVFNEDDEKAQLRLSLAALEAAPVEQATMNALRAMVIPEFMEVMKDWMNASQVNPGESPRSST